MPTYANLSNPARPVDLDNGRVLAPGESAVQDESDRATEQVAAGLLTVIEHDAAQPEPAKADHVPAIEPTKTVDTPAPARSATPPSSATSSTTPAK
ncbi:MAG: hypothetical protein M3Y91_09010 [Actinomycetota bacterium]|nr:hypothetical protein [Actinomycetota bacterium]